MHMHHERTVTVDKADLIAKIEANKKAHVKEYKEAVISYKKEATRQLKEQAADLKEGKLNLKLNLITPDNKESEYDKIIEMFKWEVEDTVSLTQSEFNEYVHDETVFAKAAKFSNSAYNVRR